MPMTVPLFSAILWNSPHENVIFVKGANSTRHPTTNHASGSTTAFMSSFVTVCAEILSKSGKVREVSSW